MKGFIVLGFLGILLLFSVNCQAEKGNDNKLDIYISGKIMKAYIVAYNEFEKQKKVELDNFNVKIVDYDTWVEIAFVPRARPEDRGRRGGCNIFGCETHYAVLLSDFTIQRRWYGR